MFSLTTLALALVLSSASVQAVQPNSPAELTRRTRLFARQGDGIPPQCAPVCYGPVDERIQSCTRSDDYPKCFCDAGFLKGFQACIDCTVATNPPQEVMEAIEDSKKVLDEALQVCANEASSSFTLAPVTIPAPPRPSVSVSASLSQSASASRSSVSSHVPSGSSSFPPISEVPAPTLPSLSQKPTSPSLTGQNPSPSESGNAASRAAVGVAGFWATCLGIIAIVSL